MLYDCYFWNILYQLICSEYFIFLKILIFYFNQSDFIKREHEDN